MYILNFKLLETRREDKTILKLMVASVPRI
jgi:hypothetical protein